MANENIAAESRTSELHPKAGAGSEKIEKIIVILLFVCAVACYANTLTNAFVYDDDQQILQNPYVKSWNYLPQIFTTNVWSFVGAAGSTNYYRPLMTLTYLILWKSFGQLPFGFHLFNIFLNALVVVGVYYTGRDLLKNRGMAAVAAFLFAVHPIHTETVAWIACVPDLEATLLLLIAFHAYTKVSVLADRKQLLVVIPLLLALLAKEPALMLVPLLILYEHFVRDDRQTSSIRTKIGRYAPVTLAGCGYLLCRVVLLGKLAPVLQHPQVSWPQAVYSGFALIAQYTKLLLWPSWLSTFHVFHPSNSLSEPPVLAGIAVVCLSLLFIGVFYRKYPELAFALVWIGFTLGPVLNSRWMAANVLAERYLYLPSVGFCWIAGWCAKRSWDALDTRKFLRKPAKTALATALLGIFVLGAAKTFARNTDWRDNITLYSRTLLTDPDSFVMHLNLGTSYYAIRNFSGAEHELDQALALRPDSVNVLNALGCLYLEQGRLDDSAKMLEKAIELKPLWTDAHFNYGRLLLKLGRRDEALKEFRTAVSVGELNSTARLFLAQMLSEDGQTKEAEEQYRRSIELSPTIEAEHGLIDILLKSGRNEEAETRMRDWLKGYPFDGEIHLKLAKLYDTVGKKPEALREYEKVLETDGKNEEVRGAIQRLRSSN